MSSPEAIFRQKLKSLKDIHRGKKAIIFTCGPSLNNVTHEQIRQLITKGYIIVCVKQAINYMPDKFAHFHIVNFCNENSYTYNPNHVPIKIYCQSSMGKILMKKPYDIVVTHGPNDIKDNILTAMMNGEDKMSFEKLLQRKELKVKWGDIMYELAIPLSMYIGCVAIYVIGWDCKNLGVYFYNAKNKVRPTARSVLRKELDKLQVRCGAILHEYMNTHFNVDLRLVGKGDESIFKIPYIDIDKL